MNRTLQRTSLAAAASLLLAVGGTPALAHDGGAKPDQSAKGIAWGKKKSALRAYQQLDRQVKKSLLRESREMKSAMSPSFDAARALAEGEYTDADIAALQSSFDAELAAALAAAQADLQAVIDARMADFNAASPSAKQSAKAQRTIDRAQAKLEFRSQQIADRFAELMDELFGSSDDDLSDDGDDSGDDSPDDGGGGGGG
jgi:hypothetical protein